MDLELLDATYQNFKALKTTGFLFLIAAITVTYVYRSLRIKMIAKIEPYTDFSSNIALQRMIKEYMSTLPFAIDYQSPEKELKDLRAVYGEAGGGAMFVAHVDNEYAGCVALKEIEHMHPKNGIRCCEMKRLYVREKYRGKNLGRKLAEKIVTHAKEMGYNYMYLDTHREAQKVAIEMYKRMAFVECEDYHPNPGRLLCLELNLKI